MLGFNGKSSGNVVPIKPGFFSQFGLINSDWIAASVEGLMGCRHFSVCILFMSSNTLLFFTLFLFFVSWRPFPYVAQAGLSLEILQLQPECGSTGVFSHAQLLRYLLENILSLTHPDDLSDLSCLMDPLVFISSVDFTKKNVIFVRSCLAFAGHHLISQYIS